jgi:hypothetical protein
LANTATNKKINEEETPLEYFDHFVSPRLYKEDALELRQNLISQLDEGCDTNVLKNALKWATCSDYISRGGYEDFFRQMSDICCKSSSYWIEYERITHRSWPDCSGQSSKQSWIPIYSKNHFFPKTTCSAISTLKLFDELTTGLIKSGDQKIMREGLQLLIANGTSPVLLQHALIWAKTRYDKTETFPSTEYFAKKSVFFERMAVICGVILDPMVLAPLVDNPKDFQPQHLDNVPIRELPMFEF